MAYRDDEEALRARIGLSDRRARELRQELAEARRREAGERKRVEALRRRLADAGVGGGRPGVREDRLDVAAWSLAIVGLPLIFLHVEWHQYVTRDPTVIPAILWLGTPGLLAALIGWPYLRVSKSCRWAAWVGVAFAAGAVSNVVTGLW